MNSYTALKKARKTYPLGTVLRKINPGGRASDEIVVTDHMFVDGDPIIVLKRTNYAEYKDYYYFTDIYFSMDYLKLKYKVRP